MSACKLACNLYKITNFTAWRKAHDHIYGDWRQRFVIGIVSSCGWNSALESRSEVQASGLGSFSLVATFLQAVKLVNMYRNLYVLATRSGNQDHCSSVNYFSWNVFVVAAGETCQSCLCLGCDVLHRCCSFVHICIYWKLSLHSQIPVTMFTCLFIWLCWLRPEQFIQ